MKQQQDTNVFLEDIIYCPSQIYFYFECKASDNERKSDNERGKKLAYIRQRGGPLTFELIDLLEDDEWGEVHKVILSREYDINNQPSEEEERREVDELESEVLEFLRQRFPSTEFPRHPIHRNIEYY